MEAANVVPGRLLSMPTLQEQDACAPSRRQFANWFGHEVLVTVELAVEQADQWDWDWAARYLLSDKGRGTYHHATAPATDAYMATMHPEWEALDKVTDAGWAASAEVKRLYRAEHPTVRDLPEAVWAEADAAYSAVVGDERRRVEDLDKAERAKILQARARAFAELYIKEGSTSE